MEVQKNKNTHPDSSDFLRLGRSYRGEYLNGKITWDELHLLVWLMWGANPVSGRVKTGYEELAEDSRGKYKKNRVNKIMLSLRRKKYMWFPSHQGRKGSFEVKIANYPLSSGNFLDISHHFEGTSNSGREQAPQKVSRGGEEVLEGKQRFKDSKNALVAQLSVDSDNQGGRSANNDNDKKNKIIDKKVSLKGIDVESFKPSSYEEQRCLEIARVLGEKDLRFLLSLVRGDKFWAVEEAWGRMGDLDKSKIDKPPAYFNSLISSVLEK